MNEEAAALGIPLPPPPEDEQPLPPPPMDEPLPPPPEGSQDDGRGAAVFLGADSETGGLDQRNTPLLSIASVVADSQMQKIDGMIFKVLPPEDTWLQVPVADQMFLPEEQKVRVHKTDFWLHLYTGTIKSAAEYQETANRYQIQAGAAEINGFIQRGPDGKWILDSYKSWLKESVALDAVDMALTKYVEAASPYKLTGVAHNAMFDEKFVSFHLPLFRQRFAKPSDVVLQALGLNTKGGVKMATYGRTGWICTMELLRAWRKKSGVEGDAKLSSLAALAGVVNSKAHDAYADTTTCLHGLRWLSRQPHWHH